MRSIAGFILLDILWNYGILWIGLYVIVISNQYNTMEDKVLFHFFDIFIIKAAIKCSAFNIHTSIPSQKQLWTHSETIDAIKYKLNKQFQNADFYL